jgi:hypothetical protein
MPERTISILVTSCTHSYLPASTKNNRLAPTLWRPLTICWRPCHSLLIAGCRPRSNCRPLAPPHVNDK